MAGVNKAILIGNLGSDPEITYIGQGERAVANFSIATSETYKNKQGEKVTNTEWHRIVLWSPLAEIAEKYLKKGSQIYIEGKITNRSYENEGVTKYVSEIVGRAMTLLSGNSKSEGQRDVPAQTAEDNQGKDDGDLPF